MDSLEALPQQDIYVSNPRLEVGKWVPLDSHCVLDIGCGAGGFGATLRGKLGGSARIDGIEAVEKQAGVARRSGNYGEVIKGYFPDDMPGDSPRYDLLVFNDVLEHMLEPWSVLKQAHANLSPSGRVLATIPSIQFAPVLWQVARGRWDYTDDGTLDRTHVRFFTRRTMIEMFEDAGYRVDSVHGVNSIAERWATDPKLARRVAKLGLARLLRDAQYIQFVVVATSVHNQV